eukprot:5312690-Pleurochrysis_carterae.AAC.3
MANSIRSCAARNRPQQAVLGCARSKLSERARLRCGRQAGSRPAQESTARLQRGPNARARTRTSHSQDL